MADTKRDVLNGLEGYTPGPWSTKLEPTSVGHVHKFEPVGGCLYVDDGGVEWRPEPEATNNARLISRAPELVEEVKALREALRECVSDLEDWQGSYGVNETTDAVLLDACALLPDTGDSHA